MSGPGMSASGAPEVAAARPYIDVVRGDIDSPSHACGLSHACDPFHSRGTRRVAAMPIRIRFAVHPATPSRRTPSTA